MTQIGIFHDNMFNCFNLACDLMEPFRPLVDRAVCDMEQGELDWDKKQRLIGLMNDEIVIDGKKQHCINAAEIYARSVFSALEEQDASLVRTYEL